MIRFLDLSVDNDDERRLMLVAIDRILASGWLLNGPEVFQFEEKIAEYCGVKFALAVGSGTSALYVSLKGLGIGRGDEVITSVLAFAGSANGIASVGATPVFVDVRDDMLIDPDAIEKRITPRTVAVMPVHFTGNVCDMDAITDICKRNGLHLIEDAAPAFGASYKGKPAGTFGIAGCVSCNTMKPLASIGEAGVVLTNNQGFYSRIIDLRYHGIKNKDTCVARSTNNRMDTIQAAILLQRLAYLHERQERRTAVAKRYNKHLGGFVRIPDHAPHVHHAWYQYTIRAPYRDALAAHLESKGIETRIYHPKILPEHPAYAADLSPYPTARSMTPDILCLPMHHKLTDADADYVIDSIKQFYRTFSVAA